MVALFFFLAALAPMDNCPSIEHYVNLAIQFDKDTICMGDSLTLTIEFRNKTNRDIGFYPESTQLFTHHFLPFGVDRIVFINDIEDVVKNSSLKLVNLPPDVIYVKKFILKSDDEFFYRKINNLIMYYHCPKFTNKTQAESNFCGTLISNKVSVYVY
ncbi:MAG: hypothetical protein LBV47_04625 [Bacteroidales bacterium]|jgi:hypothetical protein|nr:hypothetical protein [Bacteroidales bacterium]